MPHGNFETGPGVRIVRIESPALDRIAEALEALAPAVMPTCEHFWSMSSNPVHCMKCGRVWSSGDA